MAVVARMKNRMTMHNRQSPMLKQEKKSIKLIKEGGGVGRGGARRLRDRILSRSTLIW